MLLELSEVPCLRLCSAALCVPVHTIHSFFPCIFQWILSNLPTLEIPLSPLYREAFPNTQNYEALSLPSAFWINTSHILLYKFDHPLATEYNLTGDKSCGMHVFCVPHDSQGSKGHRAMPSNMLSGMQHAHFHTQLLQQHRCSVLGTSNPR